ncbi:uncharacterized protein HMPREF1541_08826 [Cyphellophora europaea CBS 101466]|uniref:Zn(2)-C6 fungal-type domain-containing protein n=1 Tax=Cyphellophora europaea (strain CBS 101466) TaxID=1220924 RepID=W2RLG5_CYPE1|nr:uncharacterized protein HMPREF1541_08826 [Cyphellophora europaea CBS 101466]ETN36548.1 hypothetical protein HMPREF1541_08826 [Cyphellophora europaea CBS 101466]
MYVPASQPYEYPLPQRIPGPRFVPESGSPDLATTTTGHLAPPRRKRASKPKGSSGQDARPAKYVPASLVYLLGSVSLDRPAPILIRRIKCDESKPSCLRCTSTGRKCDGYEFPKKTQTEPQQGRSSLSPPTKRPTVSYTGLILPASLSQPFEGTLQEKRIFHRFQVRSIPSFIGGSEANFWTKVVLKAGQQELVVRNAIIALGALHEDYQIRSGKYDAQLIEDQSYRDVTLLYGKALRQLNQRLNEPTKENAKIAIICSILFACYEVLRRNNMAAVVHYQQGMRQLMRQMTLPPAASPTDGTLTTYPNQQSSVTVRFREIPEDELDDMMRVFARYDIQACTFSKDIAEPLGTDATTPRSLPADLTISQVRTHLDNLLICVYQLIKSDLRMYRYWDVTAVPTQWQHRRTDAIKTFQDWLTALEGFFAKPDAPLRLAPSEEKSLLGLRLQIRIAIIMLQMSIDHKPETSYDAFKPDFDDMVTRVERLFASLALVDAKPLDVESVDFTMELGLIHPLFFIATKCRDWNIRRRAVALLRKAGKEGVWEGPIMAVLAQKVMRLEEQGIARGTMVPERNRFHDIKKNVDYDNRLVLFEMSKPLDGTYDNWHYHKDRVAF